jgi:flagellar basal-body rod protein FlgB
MTTIFNSINEMQRGLNFHLERQNLIAGNIANLDTPGYAPKELHRAEELGKSEFAMLLRTTDTRHMTPVGGAEDDGFTVDEEKVEIPGNDLNYVSMDHEMARLNANTLRYKVLGKLVTHQLGILRYAAQNGR